MEWKVWLDRIAPDLPRQRVHHAKGFDGRRYRIFGRWLQREHGWFYRAEYELDTGWWPIEDNFRLLRSAKTCVANAEAYRRLTRGTELMADRPHPFLSEPPQVIAHRARAAIMPEAKRMHRKDRNTYVLSTGREVSANHGLIGLAVQHDERQHQFHGEGFGSFEISEGYDGHLYDLDEWTAAERAELADFMIEQWRLFKAAAESR